MNQMWTDIRKAISRGHSGIDPDRYRFIVAPNYKGVVEQALVGAGVHEKDLDLYMIHESAAVDAGQALVMDVKEIDRQAQEAIQRWRPKP